MPDTHGGFKMLLEEGFGSPGQIQCQFLDITMLATEFGVSIPESYLQQSSFITYRPCLGDSFQLVYCDGQLLRNPDRPNTNRGLEIFASRQLN